MFIFALTINFDLYEMGCALEGATLENSIIINGYKYILVYLGFTYNQCEYIWIYVINYYLILELWCF